MSMGHSSDSGTAHVAEPNHEHENDTATTDRTLIGESTAFKYDDAAGFITEGKVVNTNMDDVPENRVMLSTVHPNSEPQHTIKKILERPVKIATITYNADFAAGASLGTYDILSTFRNSVGFRLAREKMTSFYGVNWRAHLKITLNAQPFEAGLFQIYFLPFENSVGTPYIPTNTPSEFTLPFTTGCPNVMCNIALQSEVELSVPYTGPVPFINLTNANMDFGTFHVQCVSPIVDATNAPSCELSVYMFFSQVELFGTTPNSQIVAVPQNLNSTQQKEGASKQRGPISTIGNSIVSILDMLGLSAPTANLNPERRHIDPYASPATADTVKTPLKFSYLSTQGVEVSQLGVDKADECDINYVISKPTYYNQFSWSTDQDAGTQLATYFVEPNVPTGFTVNNQIYQAPNRLRYMANLFRFWRGSIKFTFHVVCNKFHSGRLRFVYTLGGAPPTGMDVLEVYPRSFTQVVDIRDATSFEIECEYFASTAWRKVPQQFVNGAGYFDVDSGFLDDIRPFLTIYAENELRAAATTAQSIQIVCQVSAGKDFEFSVPIAVRSFPVLALADAPAAEVEGDTVDVAEPQNLSYPTVSMIGDSSDEPIKTPEPITTGEKITNVRALLKRYYHIGASQITFDGNAQNVAIAPYFIRTPQGSGTVSYELFPYFSYLYAFYRGGLRYMINSTSPDIYYLTKYNADVNLDYDFTETPYFGNRVGATQITSFDGTDFDAIPLAASVPFQSNLQGGVEVEIPYYSRFHKCLSRRLASTTYRGYEQNENRGYVPAGSVLLQIGNIVNTANSIVNFKVFRTVADDFNFGYLLGAPITSLDNLPTT